MAIIYSYPLTTNILATDVIVGTTTTLVGGRPRNQTKSFEIGDLATYFASVIAPPGTYVPYNGATGPVNLGAYNLTVNSVKVGIGSGTGGANVVVGSNNAGGSLTNGTANSFFGAYAGRFTTTGVFNTFVGQAAGYNTIGGGYNTAMGGSSLTLNTTGNYNSAFGLSSNRANTTGTGNVTVGAFSAYSNTVGNYNTHIGYGTGYFVTTGSNNVYLGYYAGRLISTSPPTTTASNSVFLGSNTSPLADSETNQIVIGDSAIGAGSNTVTLGNTSITTTRLRGNVQGGAFIKDGGTNLQYLLADGSVTTGPVVTGFVPYTGATGAVDLGAYNLTVNNISIGKGTGTGAANTAVGNLALSSATTGYNNTAFGSGSLKNITIGYVNTAIGYNAFNLGTNIANSVAVGWSAGENHATSTGSVTFIGAFAGRINTTGYNNTYIGTGAGQLGTTGTYNTALGDAALQQTTTAGSNTALGARALQANTIGTQNIAIGAFAGNTAASGGNNISGNQSVFIGANTNSATQTDTNQIVIGFSTIGSGSNTVTLGNTSITTTRLRGAVQGGSFVKDTGTATQYLMADGSVTTSGPLFKAGSNTAATGITSVISSAILGSIFTDGSILKIQTMVSFPNQTLNITPITYYINTSPSLVGATQIAIYDATVGQRYVWTDRSFWSIGGTFNSRNFGNSSQTSVSNSGAALGSTSIPATFYIIASINVGVGDLGTIASVLIEKQ